MSRLRAIALKELKAYFVSPMAAIFVGAFLLAALFSFFWLETFFARKIADLRPLFQWMPLLLIFLVSALTMRQWSEEQRMGTLEVLLTLPVRIGHLVVGKYLAVLALVAVALALTAGLPLTVSVLGNLDWGPVFGGYAGALLVASAYVAIGLFVSSRTDNQIIALISTVLLCGVLYLIGSSEVAGFFGNRTAEHLRSLGTGSRFESIERGVIDLRDLVYYGSITVFFLALNTVSVDRNRWSRGPEAASHRRNARLLLVLSALNLLALNLWLSPLQSLRLDLTEDKEFSISPVTRDLVSTLRDPLLLRGYFSARTHPLLAPLVPRIRDVMKEIAVASDGRVRVEFVDPRDDEELEAEAGQAYGIRPVPFQVAGRYEASVVNSYFDILVQYGDQHVTIGFRDLIEVQPRGDGSLDVRLRNLEYDLTRSIQKVVHGFQSVESIFADVTEPIELRAYITPSSLPEPLRELPATLRKVAGEIATESGGRFRLVEEDPDRPGTEWNRGRLEEVYGFRPIPVSILSNDSFFFHLVLAVGDDLQRIFPGADMTEAELRTEIEAALKRGASGFLKTVGLWTPPAPPPQPGMRPPVRPTFEMLRERLGESYNVRAVDLSTGRVEGDIDVLAVVAPRGLDERARFAVDQYLMRGGAVVVAGGRYMLDPASLQGGELSVRKVEGGLDPLLAHYGISLDDGLIMDDRNEPFPIPVVRRVGMFQVREIQQVNYPYFVDVRSDTMASDHPVVSSLPAVTLNWASPITLDAARSQDRQVRVLLKSGPSSWIASEPGSVQPDFKKYPDRGFAPPDGYEQSILAVSVQGVFDSYFKDREIPGSGDAAAGDSPEVAAVDPLVTPIFRSPESSRLILVGSGEFVNDVVLGISRSGGQDRFLNSLQFLQNAVDWSVEDEALLRIRSRGSQARLLVPVAKKRQAAFEAMNYGAALIALIVLSVTGIFSRRRERPMTLIRPAGAGEGR